MMGGSLVAVLRRKRSSVVVDLYGEFMAEWGFGMKRACQRSKQRVMPNSSQRPMSVFFCEHNRE